MLAPPTPNENKLEFKLETKAISNEGNYYLITFYTETYNYLIINAINKTDIFNKSFSNRFSTEKIKENKYMNMYDDLKEICNELSERIKINSLKIIEGIKTLIILVSLPNAKIKEIKFELNEIPKNEKESIENLNKLVLELKKENELLKKEIIEIKNEYKKEISEIKIEYNNIINKQNNKINKLKEQMKTWLDYKNQTELILNMNSSIINDNKNYIKMLKNWINPNKKIETQLLYRLSRDGDQISKFHELCDDKGPTLTLFKVDDGNIGGIYTPLSWDNHTTWKNDMESFMFNLNKNKKYKKIRNDCSIWANFDFGPWSYSFGFQGNNQMKKIEHRGNCINDYYENGSEILSNNSSGYKFFNVIDVEVFKINII